jgi:hypothetical protein
VDKREEEPAMLKGLLSKRTSVGAAVLGIVAALFVAVGAAATTVNPANAPTGTHYKSGTASCSVSGGTVTCSGYTLAGVGNANATATLTASYTATVVCVNGGGNPSDSQHQGSFTQTVGPTRLEPKNGNLTVPQLSASAPTAQQFLAQQTCPNPNWTPALGSAITLSSYTYTLTFAGFSGPYITITGP